MTTTAPIPPITGTATVAVSIDEAFRVFTGSIVSWWPHQFHIGRAEVAEVVREPRVNRQFDPDPDHSGEIDVRFTANGPAESTGEVEHSAFERLVGGGTTNDAIRGGGGWVLLLDGFAKTVSEQS